MSKYIDAELLRKEIERLVKINKECAKEGGDAVFLKGIAAGYADIFSLIDSLPDEYGGAMLHVAEKSYNIGLRDGKASKEQPVEGLEDEIATWIPNHIKCEKDPDLKKVVIKWAGFVARHFAEWQKAKMIEKAIECDLYYDGDFLAIDLNMAALDYSEKDKVKIIIVKED